jgi:transcriptional regulator with XRE-family HTH domain
MISVLKSIRLERGMSQREFAELLLNNPKARARYGHFEAGHLHINWRRASAWAERLNISPRTICEFDNENPGPMDPGRLLWTDGSTTRSIF